MAAIHKKVITSQKGLRSTGGPDLLKWGLPGGGIKSAKVAPTPYVYYPPVFSALVSGVCGDSCVLTHVTLSLSHRSALGAPQGRPTLPVHLPLLITPLPLPRPLPLLITPLPLRAARARRRACQMLGLELGYFRLGLGLGLVLELRLGLG